MWDDTFEYMSQTVIEFYCNYLGDQVFDNEQFNKFNDPTADCPMLITSMTPITLRTCVQNSNLWCQFYYQFAHEVTHFIFRQYKKNNYIFLHWFEETVCEAMSLFIMKYIGKHWKENILYNINKKYDKSIFTYINNENDKVGTNLLKKCNTIELLKDIEETCQDNRCDRFYERLFLYRLFIKMPNKIKAIFSYTDFLKDNGLLIDFDKWIEIDKENRSFLETVKIIQPKIENI
jgi:hypothetical protein